MRNGFHIKTHLLSELIEGLYGQVMTSPHTTPTWLRSTRVHRHLPWKPLLHGCCSEIPSLELLADVVRLVCCLLAAFLCFPSRVRLRVTEMRNSYLGVVGYAWLWNLRGINRESCEMCPKKLFMWIMLVYRMYQQGSRQSLVNKNSLNSDGSESLKLAVIIQQQESSVSYQQLILQRASCS